jgi:hypothetical protein
MTGTEPREHKGEAPAVGRVPHGVPEPRPPVASHQRCDQESKPFQHVNDVATRNITLTLDEQTLREARGLAAERGLSKRI